MVLPKQCRAILPDTGCAALQNAAEQSPGARRCFIAPSRSFHPRLPRSSQHRFSIQTHQPARHCHSSSFSSVPQWRDPSIAGRPAPSAGRSLRSKRARHAKSISSVRLLGDGRGNSRKAAGQLGWIHIAGSGHPAGCCCVAKSKPAAGADCCAMRGPAEGAWRLACAVYASACMLFSETCGAAALAESVPEIRCWS